MSRMKTDYIFSTTGTSKSDSEAARKAINAVQEVVRVSGKKDASEVKKAQAAYIKALDDAVKQFSSSR